MNTKERDQRRQQVADFIKAGHDVAEACTQFRISKAIVYEACQIHGIDHPRSRAAIKRRHLEIAEFVAGGKTPTEAAAHFGCSTTTVYEACQRNGQKPSHALSRERWKEIAAFVAAGHTLREASVEFEVCEMTASKACARSGVAPKKIRVRNITLLIIADLLNTSLSHKDIAEKHAVTGSAVGKTAQTAMAAGIKITPRHRHSNNRQR